MAISIGNTDKIFLRYLDDATKANSEATKSFLFLEFARTVFRDINANYLEKLYPVLEKHLTATSRTVVVKGRIDAFLGNLIIEFKKNLDAKSLDEAQSELRRYVAILWTQEKAQRVSYMTFATDDVHFVATRPRVKRWSKLSLE